MGAERGRNAVFGFSFPPSEGSRPPFRAQLIFFFRICWLSLVDDFLTLFFVPPLILSIHKQRPSTISIHTHHSFSLSLALFFARTNHTTPYFGVARRVSSRIQHTRDSKVYPPSLAGFVPDLDLPKPRAHTLITQLDLFRLRFGSSFAFFRPVSFLTFFWLDVDASHVQLCETPENLWRGPSIVR